MKTLESSGSPVRSEILRPRSTETRQMRRLVARVSQLPLAETHKLLIIIIIIIIRFITQRMQPHT